MLSSNNGWMNYMSTDWILKTLISYRILLSASRKWPPNVTLGAMRLLLIALYMNIPLLTYLLTYQEWQFDQEINYDFSITSTPYHLLAPRYCKTLVKNITFQYFILARAKTIFIHSFPVTLNCVILTSKLYHQLLLSAVYCLHQAKSF